jgi:ATP-binding cassette subfamily F protein uup
VLDEPTNDLDLETLDLLQEMIADYPGTVLLVSHDRDFLDRTVSSVIAFEGGGRWLEYAGGYADMVAQRGNGVSAKGLSRAPAAPQPAPRNTPAAAPKQRSKLSFKDRHALETLPGAMDKLHAEIARLQRVLDDPGLYARDAALFARTTEALSAAQAALAEAEEQWLTLEMLREEIEG